MADQEYDVFRMKNLPDVSQFYKLFQCTIFCCALFFSVAIFFSVQIFFQNFRTDQGVFFEFLKQNGVGDSIISVLQSKYILCNYNLKIL